MLTTWSTYEAANSRIAFTLSDKWTLSFRGILLNSSFERPGSIGRLVRALLGLGILSGLLLTSPQELADPDGLFWLLTAFAIWALPHIFTIGFNQEWGRWPQLVLGVLALVSIGMDWFLYHAFWAPPLAWFLYALDWLVLGSLAGSYLLASLLATPGCEWRALPDLIARLKGKQLHDPHYCPMGLDRLDRWEARRK